MNRFLIGLAIGLTLMVMPPSLLAVNEKVDVTAKPLDDPQHNTSDIEGYFTSAPAGDFDEIHVTQPAGCKGDSAGVYTDPLNDGAQLSITSPSGPVVAKVEGREGIGAIYWVKVWPGGGAGGTGGLDPTPAVALWADVKDLLPPGTLVLKDKNSGRGKGDSTDDPADAPMLYCSVAYDGKGDVEFALNATAGEYTWTIKSGDTAISGPWTGTPYKSEKLDLSVGSYTLEVTGLRCFRKIDFTVVAVDLQMDGLGEPNEEFLGAVIFENWDNDDSNSNDSADFSKTTARSTDDDDLIAISLSITPSGITGEAKLSFSSNLRVWTSVRKAARIESGKTWQLATEQVPATLYVEGVTKSSAFKDSEVTLQFGPVSDIVKITVLRLNLGAAVYRDLASLGMADAEHAGVLNRYTGARTAAEIKKDANWEVIEKLNGPTSLTTCTLASFKALTQFRGSYSTPRLSGQGRNAILRNVGRLAAVFPGYTATDLLKDTSPDPDHWNGAFSTIDQIRCDGVVEVSYELAGIYVWGANKTHYPVQNYLAEHNRLYGLETNDDMLGLRPSMQRQGPCTRMKECDLYEPTLP